MATARVSSEVLQMFYGPVGWEVNRNLTQPLQPDLTISISIQNLSPELREMILKEYITIKMRGQMAVGWDKVHEEFKQTPFCQEQKSLVKVNLKHANCGVDGLCEPCLQEEFCHKVFPGFDEYKYHSRFIVLCVDEFDHAWIHCMLRGLNPEYQL